MLEFASGLSQIDGEEKGGGEHEGGFEGKIKEQIDPIGMYSRFDWPVGISDIRYPDDEVMKSQQFTEKQGEGQSRNPADLTSS